MGYSILRAILLGIIQGIAEFLPISSSGHLVIFGDLFYRITGTVPDANNDLHMNITLHVGTLFSILVVYRHEIRHRLFQQPRLLTGIIIATIPLVFIGISPLKTNIDLLFKRPLYAGCGLLVTSALLFSGEFLQRKNRTSQLKDINPLQAIIVGLFQAVAIIPGISRSGSTISAGLLCGINREDAASFSFLIAIPAIAGAAILMLKDIWLNPIGSTTSPQVIPLCVGGFTAFIVGWGALRCLLAIIGKGKLHYFAIYCLFVGATTIIWQLGWA